MASYRQPEGERDFKCERTIRTFLGKVQGPVMCVAMWVGFAHYVTLVTVDCDSDFDGTTDMTAVGPFDPWRARRVGAVQSE